MHANYARFSKIIFKELTRLCWMIFQIYKFNLTICDAIQRMISFETFSP